LLTLTKRLKKRKRKLAWGGRGGGKGGRGWEEKKKDKKLQQSKGTPKFLNNEKTIQKPEVEDGRGRAYWEDQGQEKTK